MDSFPERPLLGATQRAAWRGLPLGCFAAADHDDARNLWAPYACLGLLIDGRARATIRGSAGTREIHLDGGVAGLFGPEFEIYRSTWHCRDGRRIFVELTPESYAALGVDDELLPDALRQDLATPDPDLHGLLRAMTAEAAAGSPHGALYAQSLSQGLLRHLHRQYGGAAGAGQLRSGARLGRAQLARVREHLQAHLAGNPTLAELAGVAGVSRAHLARLFARTLGVSPHQYLLALRLREARRLLLHTALPLAQVALDTGFASQSHFGTLFRRETGLSPGAFRRSFSAYRIPGDPPR
ncbi:helix-turn-helix domain-containing protein [Pseudorhodoferax sp. Leaf274]|uniref:helix-turn-helix domain-containing protein n=1 Tax=Pseudorhodoferax sp. Leaf274 TaxID=1736318 RepID=UPI0012E22911|nr:AraC family transcriptional regulator [Pseudorhodoferax sp. Leaf274]